MAGRAAASWAALADAYERADCSERRHPKGHMYEGQWWTKTKKGAKKAYICVDMRRYTEIYNDL
jgi:hypothetical protein